MVGNLSDAISISYRCATKFLNDKSHRQIR